MVSKFSNFQAYKLAAYLQISKFANFEHLEFANPRGIPARYTSPIIKFPVPRRFPYFRIPKLTNFRNFKFSNFQVHELPPCLRISRFANLQVQNFHVTPRFHSFANVLKFSNFEAREVESGVSRSYMLAKFENLQVRSFGNWKFLIWNFSNSLGIWKFEFHGFVYSSLKDYSIFFFGNKLPPLNSRYLSLLNMFYKSLNRWFVSEFYHSMNETYIAGQWIFFSLILVAI